MLLCSCRDFWGSEEIVNTETEYYFAYVGFSTQKCQVIYKHLIKWALPLAYGLSVEVTSAASEEPEEQRRILAK